VGTRARLVRPPVRRAHRLLPSSIAAADGSEAHASLDPLFTDTRRAFFANRGVSDAISSAGPHPGFAHQDADVDVYLGILGEFLDEMCQS
jgi:hypothetical protein